MNFMSPLSLPFITRQITTFMFSLFKKKSPIDKLQSRYDSVMKEAHQLSTVNRAASDQRYAEADDINKQIDALLKQQS